MKGVMKLRQLMIAMMLLCAVSIRAIPAHPGTVKVKQPDGTFVTLRLVGDEWRHFQTTADGYSVVKNGKGYYVYAEKKNGELKATAHVAHDEAERSETEQAYLATVKKYQTPEMSERMAEMRQQIQQRQQETLASRRAQGNRATDYENFRGLIVLATFKDKDFSRPDYPEIINDMVNKEDYTGYDGKKLPGSVRDYFSDNSGGKFQPQFDVVGPYQLEYSQYDCNIDNEEKTAEILIAALDSAEVDSVKFHEYDGDGDGYVDLVYFIFAGNGANYGDNDENLWWPHRFYIIDPKTKNWVKKDGVYFRDYASSVELQGYTSYPQTIKIDGIGTICHEFSHVLGLPDFYDTDYEGSGGMSAHPGDWSLMASGGYLDDSNTPVGYSLFERYSVGFCDVPEIINAEGTFTLEPLATSFQGYRINSAVNDEFFLFENRQKTAFKWDKFLPGSGMLVHRVEKPGKHMWNGRNNLNVNPEHNLYEVVWANGKGRAYTAADVFPGSKKVSKLNNTTSPANLKSWSGKETEWGLYDIAEDGGIITFSTENTFVLRELHLTEKDTVAVGLKCLLKAIAVPEYAHYTLTWSSDNENIATVDEDGCVTGVAKGTCNITVVSNTGLEATCQLTVEKVEVVSVDDLFQLEVGTEVVLQLDDTHVHFVSNDGKTAYVRDAKGSIMFKDTGLELKKNDVLNGYIIAQVGEENRMRQVVGIEGKTDLVNVTLTEGEDLEPREVQMEDLTAKDYSDYIVVKAVQIEKEDKYNYAVSGDMQLRIWNKYAIKTAKVPSNTAGKYYDVTSIFGTDVLNGEVIDELYLMASPVEVEAPTGIKEVRCKTDEGSDDFYNLNGQRVDRQYRGLVIRNGRVVLNK